MIGLILVAAFVFSAVFGPMIAPYDPKKEMLAAPLSLPQWLTFFPAYSNYAPSLSFNVKWTANSSSAFDFQLEENSTLGELLKRNRLDVWSVQYVGNSAAEVEFTLYFSFAFNYLPPESFGYSFRWLVPDLNETGYNVELTLIRFDKQGTKEYSLWDSNFKRSFPKRSTAYSYSFGIPGSPVGFPSYVEVDSAYDFLYKGRLNFADEGIFLSEAFAPGGSYVLEYHIRLSTNTNNSTFAIQIFDCQFSTLGSVHGLLGTDDRGRDIFSRVLYGTQVSLMVGLLVAILATSVGVIVGTLSGFFGGLVDEASMGFVDFLLCLPTLPLLLASASMFNRNLYVAMLIIIFQSWMPLARMTRSQVLSLRESAFIEAATGLGCTRLSILRKHILPNVMPLAFSFMILSVPAAILIEASLSFLGLSDPGLITWGRIINEAMQGGAIARDAWWWLFAPGIAIVVVCLGFVFIANAFDKIVNPRLRMRR